MITGTSVNVAGHNENYSGLPVIVLLQLSFFLLTLFVRRQPVTGKWLNWVPEKRRTSRSLIETPETSLHVIVVVTVSPVLNSAKDSKKLQQEPRPKLWHR